MAVLVIEGGAEIGGELARRLRRGARGEGGAAAVGRATGRGSRPAARPAGGPPRVGKSFEPCRTLHHQCIATRHGAPEAGPSAQGRIPGGALGATDDGSRSEPAGRPFVRTPSPPKPTPPPPLAHQQVDLAAHLRRERRRDGLAVRQQRRQRVVDLWGRVEAGRGAGGGQRWGAGGGRVWAGWGGFGRGPPQCGAWWGPAP
jgi:hypothetical protein